MITTVVDGAGIAEIVVDYPPVNALPVAGWYALADALRAAGANPAVRVVVLRAEGRGFNAGVDIKEIQRDPGHGALIGANRGCFAAFAAVYECAVPVVAAVHGFCLGGGIGLVGNADVIVASEDATFGLPEVDRGALGAATHLSRLVPQLKARAMMYTSATATAAELHAFGSVHTVVPRARLREAAHGLAAEIAAKDPRVIRMAKEAFNGIDPWDVKRSYRYEQGFTFELNLAGIANEVRADFGSPLGPANGTSSTGTSPKGAASAGAASAGTATEPAEGSTAKADGSAAKAGADAAGAGKDDEGGA